MAQTCPLRSAKSSTPAPADVVHGNSTRFTLGALGLPVIYPDGFAVYPVADGNLLRRASRLWLRPVGERDQWRLLSFAFLGQFLPGEDQPEVHLLDRGRLVKTLSVTDGDVVALATAWIGTLAADKRFSPGDRPASD